jgi:hypothetical protein
MVVKSRSRKEDQRDLHRLDKRSTSLCDGFDGYKEENMVEDSKYGAMLFCASVSAMRKSLLRFADLVSIVDTSS